MADTFGSVAGPANFANLGMQIGGNQVFPILQIIQSTSTTVTSTTSSTYQSTNCTANITPKFNTSKILVFISGMLEEDATADQARISLFRGASDLDPGATGFVTNSTSVTGLTGTNVGVSFMYYDSPATTSSTTYTVKLKSTDNTNTVKFGNGGAQIMILIEVAQ